MFSNVIITRLQQENQVALLAVEISLYDVANTDPTAIKQNDRKERIGAVRFTAGFETILAIVTCHNRETNGWNPLEVFKFTKDSMNKTSIPLVLSRLVEHSIAITNYQNVSLITSKIFNQLSTNQSF
jgi:hypothetical protein